MIDKRVYQIFINNKGAIYQPVISGKVKITWNRNFSAGILEFSVVKDELIDYQEGNTVTFSINGETVFKGFVFRKKRTGKQVIDTVCYDQIRYLKNKDTYQYKSLSYSDLLKKICEDRLLQVGEIEDTSYSIPKALEQNQEFLKMLENGNDITVSQTGKLFTLFDDKGKISLKSPQNMVVDYPVSYDNAVDFDYETSIDNGTYNRIVVYLVDDDGNQIKKIIAEDRKSIENWGVLTYTVTTNNDEDIDNKAKQLLELFNRKYRSLTLKNVIGDIRVRAGSLIPVEMMEIGDININSYMLVQKVIHTFYDDYHFMDLEVLNKDIMPIGSGDSIIKDKKKETNKMSGGSGVNWGGTAPNEQIEAMIQSGFSMLGDEYTQSGKRTQKGYSDCSSYVWKAMRDAGFDVPSGAWNTGSMLSSGLFKPISFSEVRPGDVGILPKTKNKSGHTVIALSKDEVIHATPPRAKKSNMGQYGSYQYYRPVNKG